MKIARLEWEKKKKKENDNERKMMEINEREIKENKKGCNVEEMDFCNTILIFLFNFFFFVFDFGKWF